MQVSEYVPAISAVTALIAVIAGPCVQLYIAKRQIKANTIAAFRQNWINAVRDELSNFFGAVYADGAIIATHDIPQKNGSIESAERMMRSAAKLQLLLNPGESDHARLITLVKLFCSSNSQKMDRNSDFERIAQEQGDIAIEVIQLSQAILKREWERVKNLH